MRLRIKKKQIKTRRKKEINVKKKEMKARKGEEITSQRKRWIKEGKER